MLREVTLPEISENVDSGEVIAVLVSVGDVVEKDQPVVELETEKAAFEVPSPSRGRIAEIDVKVGQTVKVGAVLAKLQTDGEFVPGPKPPEKHPAEPQVIAEVVEEPATPPPPEEMEPDLPQTAGSTESAPPVRIEPEKPASGCAGCRGAFGPAVGTRAWHRHCQGSGQWSRRSDYAGGRQAVCASAHQRRGCPGTGS